MRSVTCLSQMIKYCSVPSYSISFRLSFKRTVPVHQTGVQKVQLNETQSYGSSNPSQPPYIGVRSKGSKAWSAGACGASGLPQTPCCLGFLGIMVWDKHEGAPKGTHSLYRKNPLKIAGSPPNEDA